MSEKLEIKDELKDENVETREENLSEDFQVLEELSAENVEAATKIVSEHTNEEAALRQQAQWYALHTFTGYEQMVEENLKLVIEKYNLQKRVFDIVIPMEDVIEEKRGKRKIVSRKLMPGYVLCKMIYGDDIWHAITRTRGITGFVGPKGRPLPLTEEEVFKMKLEKIKVDVNLKIGDKIEIIDGALAGQIGEITGTDLAIGKVRATVNMFGRDMPVDLELSQIRRV